MIIGIATSASVSFSTDAYRCNEWYDMRADLRTTTRREADRHECRHRSRWHREGHDCGRLLPHPSHRVLSAPHHHYLMPQCTPASNMPSNSLHTTTHLSPSLSLSITISLPILRSHTLSLRHRHSLTSSFPSHSLSRPSPYPQGHIRTFTHIDTHCTRTLHLCGYTHSRLVQRVVKYNATALYHEYLIFCYQSRERPNRRGLIQNPATDRDDLLKIQQETEMIYSKSSKRER